MILSNRSDLRLENQSCHIHWQVTHQTLQNGEIPSTKIHSSQNGVFTVRSAYHLRMRQNHLRNGSCASSSTVDAHKGWLALWSVNVPGKIKVHVWRLLQNGLALGAELSRRHIKEGVSCVACGREETAIHR